MLIKNLRNCPQHLQQLAEWHHKEWQHLNPGQTLQDRIIKMQDYLNDDFIPSTFIAFDQNQRPLGSAAIVENDLDIKPDLSPWLASVFVHPDHRRQGIGTALVKTVMHEAKNNHVSKLYLFTEGKARYYQRLGWVLVENAIYLDQDIAVMFASL